MRVLTDRMDEMLLCSEGLELKNEKRVLQQAEEIHKFLTENFPERKMKRNAILGSCLYIAGILHGEQVSQSNLARSFGISGSTLNRGYKEIVNAIRTKCRKEFIEGFIEYRSESFCLKISLDRKIHRTCQILTSKGLETVASCQGHFKGEKEYRKGRRKTPYVSFIVRNKENLRKLEEGIERMERKNELEIRNPSADYYVIEFKARSSEERNLLLKNFNKTIENI